LLVFGQSVGSARLGDSQGGIGGSASASAIAAPYALTPGGYNTGSHFGMTPPPAGMTPLPGGAPQTLGFGTAAVTTGAPIAHTFAGIPGGPQSKKGLLIAAGAGFLVLVMGIVGLSLALKGKNDPAPAAASGAVASVVASTAAPTPVAVAPAPSPTHETLAPPVTEPPQALAAPVSVAKARPQYNPAAAPPPAAKPAPAAPAKKQKVDLGI
jgi:hypothetical protein